jgi:hypothetical protein
LPSLFNKKSRSDLLWRLVDYIQTCVKDPIGIGKPINIHFYAPINENNFTSQSEINYDFNYYGDDLVLLEK